MIEAWFILAIAYAFCHATVGFLDKLVLRKKIYPLSLNNVRFAFNSIIAFVIILFFFQTNLTYSSAVWILFLAISIIYFLSTLGHFFGLQLEDVSKAIPYREGLSTFLAYALPIIFLFEKLTVYHTIGTLVIIIGTYIILSDGKKIIPKLSKGIMIITISGIAMPVIGVLSKVAVENVNPMTLNFFTYTLVFLYITSTSIYFKPKELKETAKFLFEDKKLLGIAFTSSLLATVGTLFLNFALTMGKASQVLPLSRTLPLFAVIYGSLFLKEKYSKVRFFGAALIVAGMFLINF